MKALVESEDEDVQVPLTPLLDVVFLLLIFFLLATSFMRRELDVPIDPPDAALSGIRGQKPVADTLVIYVTRAGEYFVEGVGKVERAWLEEKIRQVARTTPPPRLVLRTDRNTTQQSVVWLYVLCGREQLPLSLSLKATGEETPPSAAGP